jgi:3D-(3,5/4)-trihydroxycyclohexane-1,2-dione acylhydrolase (decyclizing)
VTTVRLTVGQAIVRFLVAQRSERDGLEHRLIEGMFGIFGHGNVAGLGEAVLAQELADPHAMPYYQARNEQGMVHAATGFARQRNRLSTMACLSSIGPGATNMVTGAATGSVTRLPVLVLPSEIFATGVADPVLQQLEHPRANDISVNDCFRPVARFFDRVWRPEQLPSALLGEMRVLTDPVETGAAVIALPEDVQAEAHDWPEELFETRVWHVTRPVPEAAALAHEHGALLLVDACQTVGRLPVDVADLGADLLVASGHKVYGPPGTGFLVASRRARLRPVLVGDERVRRRR